MQVNRGFAFWGVALITAGVVALAIQAGLVTDEAASQAWRLWPVVLIVIGSSRVADAVRAVATMLSGLLPGRRGTLWTGFRRANSAAAASRPRPCPGRRIRVRRGVVLDFNCATWSFRTAAGRVERGGAPRVDNGLRSGESAARVSLEGGGFILRGDSSTRRGGRAATDTLTCR